MDPITQQLLLGAAGAAGEDPVYVDDVFSADAYRGVSSARKFVNGIELGSNVGVSLNGKTITDTTGGGANYTQLIDDIFSSANSNYYYGSIDCYIDYGSAVVSTFFDLAPQGDNRIGAVYNTPTSVTGYGSNNASSWTSLGAQSFNANSWSEGSFTSYNFLSNTTAYRYYRLTVSGTKALQEWRLGITDSELGKGGLVWIKNRFSSGNHVMMDTDTGVTKYLSSNNTAVTNQTEAVTSYNNNGFSLGTDARVNSGNADHIAWTFRKQPGFFDIVSWTGDGTSNRVLNHNLESKPGMMLIQCTSSHSQNWFVYHHSLGVTKKLVLNDQSAESNATGDSLSNTEPTATQFTLGFYLYANASNRTYVAYLFADDDARFGTSGDESIIKCGSYTGTGRPSDLEVDLGFEPQFLLIKFSGPAGSAPWMMVDQARGFQGYPGDNLDTYSIGANATDAETYNGGKVRLTARGFKFKYEQGLQYNESGKNYVYMAIRRPHKPPETATEVFNALSYLGNNSNPRVIAAGFAPDTVFGRKTQSDGTLWYDRIRGEDYYLSAYGNGAQGQNTDYMNQFLYDGYQVNSNWNSTTGSVPYNHYVFRRAPGFYDVVTYSGNGGNQNITHNLEVAPEFYMVKRTSASEDWATYSAALGANKYTKLNSNGGTGAPSYTNTTIWNNTSPTSSVLTVGNDPSVNGSGSAYIAFLFATLPGISKIGSYTGTGNAINVDCGFTNGARYIIIRRTDSSGDWYQFSTILGITNTAAPHYFFNLTTYVSGTDYIDPLAAGFTVTSSAPAGLNASGGTYIFIAFA